MSGPATLAIPYIAPTNPVYMGRFANGTACAAEQVDSELGWGTGTAEAEMSLIRVGTSVRTIHQGELYGARLIDKRARENPRAAQPRDCPADDQRFGGGRYAADEAAEFEERDRCEEDLSGIYLWVARSRSEAKVGGVAVAHRFDGK
jgi:hypothetical protein